MDWGAVRAWVAIVLLLDASFGLWNHERLKKVAPKLNVLKIALFEALVVLILLVVPYLF